MNLNDETKEPEIVREELKLLIGYANWNADAVCAILTAADENSIKAKEMIKKMLEAELTVIHASTELGEIVSKIEPWALKNFGSHNLNEKSQSNKPIFSQKDSNQFKSHNTSSFGKSNVKGLSKFGGKH
jgi:hypothetical protein